MNREEIMKHIPHRAPMLLVDEVTMDADGTGHGKILCEIMAQSCTRLMLDVLPGNLAVYRGIDKVTFKNTVRPGDLCEITCRIDENKAGIFHCTAKLEVNGKLCCRGKLAFAVIPDPMKATA